MTCSPFDLRDYLFEELTPAQSGDVRSHLKTCTPCRSEVEALRSTRTALLTLRDEDIPQRIGFVSDKVFEPSPLRRWFAAFWTSAARIGFVSSALLSAAILVHAFVQVHNSAQPPVHNNAQSAITQADISNQINEAVKAQLNQAVADIEQRAQKRTDALLAAAEKRLDLERWALTAQTEQARYNDLKHNAALLTANYESAQ